jgi:hypothetical protein
MMNRHIGDKTRFDPEEMMMICKQLEKTRRRRDQRDFGETTKRCMTRRKVDDDHLIKRMKELSKTANTRRFWTFERR